MEFLYSGIGIALGITVISIYVNKLRTLLVQAAELLIAVDKMLEDGKVSTEEVAKIVLESKDVWNAVKAFGKK